MRDAALALAVLVAAAVVVRLIWRKVLVRERWLGESTATPVFLMILALGAHVIVERLAKIPPLSGFFLAIYLTGATYVLAVSSVAWVVYGVVKGLSEWYLANIAPKTDSTLDTTLIPAFRRITKLVLVFVAAAVVLGHYDYKITALLGAAGVASLAVALAAQDTLANVIAGFTIILDRPFRLGDRLELSDGRIGDVVEIGLRTTRILSFDHNLYIIPNSELAKSSVINHSYPSDKVKVRQTLPVAYGADIELVRRIVVETCRAHPLVLPDPPPEALLTAFGDTALRASFFFWIADYRTQAQVVNEVNTAIYARFQQEGIPAPPSPPWQPGDGRD
jgi:small-conductance mechanosensitive channel